MNTMYDVETLLSLLLRDLEEQNTYLYINGNTKKALGPYHRAWFDMESHVANANRNAWNIYFMVNEGDGQGTEEKNVTRVRGFFIDSDDSNPAFPEVWPLEPTLIFQRDSDHQHAYWLLSDEAPLDEFTPIQQLLARYYNSDTQIINLNRLMRVPSTKHYKKNKKGSLIMSEGYELVGGSKKKYTYAHIKEAHKIAQANIIVVTAEPKADPLAGDMITSGLRHAAAHLLACRIRDYGSGEKVMRIAIQELRTNRFEDPDSFDDAELEQIISSVMRKEPEIDVLNVLEGTAILQRNSNNMPIIPEGGKHPRKDPGMHPPKFPHHLLSPGGTLQRMMDHVLERAYLPQPMLALGSALATLSCVISGAVRCDYASPTLLMVGLAGSGMGKDAPLRELSHLLRQVPQSSDMIISGDFASDAGFISSVVDAPNGVCYMDEFGDKLKTALKQDNSWTARVFSLMKEIFSASEKTYYGRAFKDIEKRIIIDHPHFNLYATGVPSAVWESLTAQQAKDGFLPRLILLDAGNKRPEAQMPRHVPPTKKLLKDVQHWAAQNLHERVTITITSDALELHKSFTKKCHDECDQAGTTIGPFWSRAPQHVNNLALVHACSRSQAPLIEACDMQYAIDLMDYSTRTWAFHILNNMSDNKTEEMAQRVRGIIEDSGAVGLTHTQLTSKTMFLRGAERKDVMQNLCESGRVVCIKVKKPKGRPAFHYWVQRFAPSSGELNNG